MRIAPQIGVSLAMALGMSGEALADKACEQFIDASVQSALIQFEDRTSDHLKSSFQDFVVDKVDIARIARFTLGKYSQRQSEANMQRFSIALQGYFADMLYSSVSTSSGASAEILGSHDRQPTDCIVETVFHLGDAGDSVLLWRIFHQGEDYKIYDVALRDSGNTLWLSMELRAQFASLLGQRNGSIDLVIDNLNARTSGP